MESHIYLAFYAVKVELLLYFLEILLSGDQQRHVWVFELETWLGFGFDLLEIKTMRLTFCLYFHRFFHDFVPC